ncbi:MAG TPA: MFS transporter [Candidatus Stackebrandtia excrementipullorum]|nr:MFS transporter [Candidatus Stackebrandtia excrementipullorum]
MRALFTQRGFPALFAGTASATVGDWLMLLVLAIWVKDLTGLDGAAGLVMFCLGTPMLVAPLFAVVVDRFPHRPFLVVANVLNAMFLLPLLFVDDAADVWLVYLTAFLLGIGSTVDGPALNGLRKKLLPERFLVDANGLSQTVRQGMRLGGPLAGAGLYLVGGGTVVAITAMGFLLLAAALIGCVRLAEERPTPTHNGTRNELVAGFAFVRRTASLRRAVVGLMIAGVSLGAIESVAFAITDTGLGRGPEFVSVIVSFMGIGGLVGGLSAAPLVRRVGELATCAGGLVAIALSLAVWTIPSTVTVLAVAPLLGFALPLVMVAANTLAQRESPNDVIGRVSSAVDQSFAVPQVFSIAMGAGLVTVVDYRLVLVGMALIMMTGGWYLYNGRVYSAPDRTIEKAA